jgi:hypothetical protein
MRVDLLEKKDESQYQEFVRTHPRSMLYYDLKWRDLLSKLTRAKPLYLVCKEAGTIVGVMPAFMAENARGKVINALPFFGCHGAPLVVEQAPAARKLLLNFFESLARNHGCLSSTFITNPFEDNFSLDNDYKPTYLDERIGQITDLALKNGDEMLLQQFAGRTRTAIRKAEKEGIEWRVEKDGSILSRVCKLHQQNISALGGIPKPIRFFNLVQEIFQYGADYEILTACKDDRAIAYLLLFYYKDTVEYYTPCVKKEYRPLQPLSLLIYEGMRRAHARGCKKWNFGGTWKTQAGVYQFKKSWGAKDFSYYYYVKVYDDRIKKMAASELVKEFPYFYVLPFHQLEASS